MSPNTIRGMEPLTRQKFHFATSAFARLYGVDHVTASMIDFCYDWSFTEDQPPRDCLNHVDRYFREKWDTSQGSH